MREEVALFWKTRHRSAQQRGRDGSGCQFILIAVLVLGAVNLAPFSTSAEGLADISADGALTGEEDMPLVLNSPVTLGGRAGYWFDGPPWYGGRADLFYVEPDVERLLTTTALGSTLLLPVDVPVAGIGLDVVRFRSPLPKSTKFPNGYIQPDLSPRPVVSIVTVKDRMKFFIGRRKGSGKAVGFEAGSGLTVMVRKKSRLVGEYKRIHASAEVQFHNVTRPFSLETVEIDISTQYVIGGVTLAF